LETMSCSKLAAVKTAVTFVIFTKVCRVFYHFGRHFLLSLEMSTDPKVAKLWESNADYGNL